MPDETPETPEEIERKRQRHRLGFIDAHKHLLAGIVTDAFANQKAGAEGSMFLRLAMKRIDAEIGKMFDELLPPPAQPGRK